MWLVPVPYALVPTHDSDSHLSLMSGCVTGLPLFPHRGAFAVPRKFHVHTGVDLYVPDGTLVRSVEYGEVVAISPFTGSHAGTPWWEETWVVLVEGESGVVAYGEVTPIATLRVGDSAWRGIPLGFVKQGLRIQRKHPTSMLHVELHRPGTRTVRDWPTHGTFPETLRDPTHRLMGAVTIDIGSGQEIERSLTGWEEQ